MERSDLVGLAAPQVGIPLQIFVIHFPHPHKYFSKEEIILKKIEHVKNQASILFIFFLVLFYFLI